MNDLKLTPTLVAMLERIERHSGAILMLAVTASGGGEYGKLNKLRGAGYVVKCDHLSVTEGAWPDEALAITEAGRTALATHRAELAEKKGRHRPGDKRVIFRPLPHTSLWHEDAPPGELPSDPQQTNRQAHQTPKLCKKRVSPFIIAPRAQASRRCETQAPLGGKPLSFATVSVP